MSYVISITANHSCYLAQWEGDPGRTHKIERAINFKSKRIAEKACREVASKYPNREFKIEEI